MKNLILSFFCLWACLSMVACSSESTDTSAESADSLALAKKDSIMAALIAVSDSALANRVEHLKMPDTLSRFFDKYGVTGAFVLLNPQTGAYYYHNIEKTSEPLLPASTFKILHALIALETGALADTSEVFKWNGKDYGVENWNKDQTLRSAIKNSTVWVFQEIAKRIGQKRMQHYVNLANYGNKDIGGGIDHFWLDGDLRITMQEQIYFLRSLYREELPFSKKSMRIVTSMLNHMENEHYTLYGKTGWAKSKKAEVPDTGWFVGYIILNPIEETTGDVSKDSVPKTRVSKDGVPKGYYFATVVDIKQAEDAKAREAVTLDILKHIGLM